MNEQRLVEAREKLRSIKERLDALVDKSAALHVRLDGDVPLGVSLDHIAEEARRATAEPRAERSGEDGLYLGDSWEIALASEESD